MNQDYEVLKHLEDIQLSIVNFAFRVCTIVLGAPIAALYAYNITLGDEDTKGIEYMKITVGINPPVLIDNLLFWGFYGLLTLSICASVNWWRILGACKQEAKKNWYNIILNLIPVIALFAISFLCFYFRGKLLR